MTCCGLTCFCQLLGCITAGYVIYLIINLIRQLTRPSLNLEEFGNWSIVTGGTNGIGKEIVMELAKKGQNVLIIGRNADKLSIVKDEVKSKYPKSEIETLQIDLAQLNGASVKRFSEAIANKDIGILVNNAGIAYEYTQYFDEVSEERIQDMMSTNSIAPTLLIHRVIKEKFLKKTTEKKGAIINISSAGSVVPHELHSVYSASKAYINKISQDLALEYGPKGIEIQVQLPYFVVTNMSKIKRASFTTPTAQQFARYSVAQFGYSGLVYPYPIHAVIFFFLQFVPTFILEKFIGNMHHTVRKIAMSRSGKKTN